jgi:hypothetical protein
MGGKGSGGHNRKPVEQKQRIGNPGRRALPKQIAEVVALPVSSVPEPHRPLSKYGRELWDRLWVAGAAWLKPTSDAEAVLLVCEATDERQQLRVRVLSDPDAWRDRKALRELEKQIASGLGELGMNPVDRGRLGMAEVKENEFAKLHHKIAARRNASGS